MAEPIAGCVAAGRVTSRRRSRLRLNIPSDDDGGLAAGVVVAGCCSAVNNGRRCAAGGGMVKAEVGEVARPWSSA